MSAIKVSGPDDKCVTTLSLNVPERRNAISDEMREQLVDICESVDRSSRTRVVILTGSGVSFCAGGDLNAMAGRISDGTDFSSAYGNYSFGGAKAAERISNLTRPLIVAVNGAAFGAGLSIAMLGDIRIASEDATFAAPFSRRGLVPDWGLVHSLPRVIGPGPAADLFFTGRVVNADEALRMGMISEITKSDSLMERAYKRAVEIAEMAPLAVQATKRLMQVSRGASFGDTLGIEAVEQARLQQTSDYREGIAAFHERRRPNFLGA